MSLYGNLNKELLKESSTKDVVSLEETYEFFYNIISRLQDMDDFTNSMLLHVEEKVSRGESFKGALLEVIDKEYGLADADYFRNTINYLENDLKEIFARCLETSNIEQSWNAEIDFLAKNKTIKFGNKDYTLDLLQKAVEGGAV